ncbi:hypothetical protein [Jannaschia seosinensis]|uniref:hypothetical protein n=1 Tax=Jannaschia seosinensis TaxID=313367 RepID=UPI0011875F41|nr:hypothetical protein [Jannaschia seosinensis]
MRILLKFMTVLGPAGNNAQVSVFSMELRNTFGQRLWVLESGITSRKEICCLEAVSGWRNA